MKTSTSFNTPIFSSRFFLLNAASCIGGVVTAIRISTQAPSFNDEVVFSNLFCVDISIMIALCFLLFCGVLAAFSATLSFLYSFFNTFALFQHVNSIDLGGARKGFMCFFLCVSFLIFCFAAQNIGYQLLINNPRKRVCLHFMLTFVSSLLSLLLIFLAVSVIK